MLVSRLRSGDAATAILGVFIRPAVASWPVESLRAWRITPF